MNGAAIISLLVLPVMFGIYCACRVYVKRLEAQKNHAEELASLHERTMEALALAIDAKDYTTHDHLRRVRVYAEDIGKELGLSENELDALRAAAILHDIGKLAIPEHIVSKPGRLTPEEFEKLKIHPVVGAEILERASFPCPVAPIVRSHHEKWDGTGYPDGLKGEEIPIGARILAVVDCLHALASERQYRRALRWEEAMRCVVAQAGTAFDPRVIEVLQRLYPNLERAARMQGSPDFIHSIAAARQELQVLFQLTCDLGTSLSLQETLSLLDIRLKRIVPYDSMAIYVQRSNRLHPEFVHNGTSRLSVEISAGEGLADSVAQHRKPILNGDPAAEPGCFQGPASFSVLRSALAVPLEGPNGLVGVLALYHKERHAFSRDHLRILQALSDKLAMCVENAEKYQRAERSAATDGLTGLPNACSLFLHLDSELARCKREETPLMVLVCDLDGFKAVNDRFGHLEGNRVLQMVAQGLRESCRAYDYVARMGGDEFVLVLPGEKPEVLQTKLQRLVEMVSRVGREVTGEDGLALSIGQAAYPRDGSAAEQLLAEADRRMYAEKQRHKAAMQVPHLASKAIERRVVVQ